ncbi:hypothetical protein [Pseudooceanicola sp.]|jgi:hypothetical protein|uniref:hypothetical protein n=1 Tax=Pseudooceanicola sp. TaxID=1914328 RepID=UPI004059066A
MTLRTILTATVLTLLPAFAWASCSYHEQQARSCADGFSWDAEAKACVQQVNS